MDKLSSKERDSIFESIILNNWNAIVFANMEGIVELVNPAANELYGYEGDELIGQNVDIFNSHQTHNTEEIVESIISKGHWHGELVQRRKDDSTFDALLHVQLIHDMEGNPLGYASNSKDITSDKESAKKLKQTIQEKEILLRELHHRVKNNLSTIKGILNLQIDSSKQDDPESLFADFQNRLNVLVEAHQNININQNTQEIDLSIYLKRIVDDVTKLFLSEEDALDLKLNVIKKQVSMDIAIPLGLIANELVTNSCKHAFRTNGKLEIILDEINPEEKRCKFQVKDNGPGFDFDGESEKNSLGLSLIDGLVNQLDGEYDFNTSEKGTEFTLTFNCKINN